MVKIPDKLEIKKKKKTISQPEKDIYRKPITNGLHPSADNTTNTLA